MGGKGMMDRGMMDRGMMGGIEGGNSYQDPHQFSNQCLIALTTLF